MKADELKKAWKELLQAAPAIRIREAAARMGTSEAQLLATGCGRTVTRLKPEFETIWKEIPSQGRVMALTRNADCVHEKTGVYPNPQFFSGMGLLQSADIDLRLFLSSWHLGFAVREKSGEEETRRSLQFFNRDGTAVHKIFLLPESDADAFDRVVDTFAAEDQSPEQEVEAAVDAVRDLPDDEIDLQALRAAWEGLTDTHDFHAMLEKQQAGRLQALRLIGEDLARPVAVDAVRMVLQSAAEEALPVMVFTGNTGCIQIHAGAVRNLTAFGDWFNVLDPNFNFHLRMAGIDSAWVVRKPTVDGPVHSLELYDRHGAVITQLFGKRSAGNPELEGWTRILETLSAPERARKR